ncbi:MAG: hypothetical protein KatS3mg043_1248 [Rhodothermaceae bacterium]|nr:MAG: hypothetical protein KatS3mg043_1248 [Rhodothermaceae bacterium]
MNGKHKLYELEELTTSEKADHAIQERDELISIFVTSIKTATANARARPQPSR